MNCFSVYLNLGFSRLSVWPRAVVSSVKCYGFSQLYKADANEFQFIDD